MFVSIYYKPSLFNAHSMILTVHIFMNVNKLCLNQVTQKVVTLQSWPWTDIFNRGMCVDQCGQAHVSLGHGLTSSTEECALTSVAKLTSVFASFGRDHHAGRC